MTTTVVGVFQTEQSAQTAVNNLRDMGVPLEDISVIARPQGDIYNERGEVINVTDEHMTAGEGLTVGAVWGGLVGLAALALPGIGPLVTSNIFTAALTGAVAGAATGGIAGALIDAASVPEEHANVYAERVHAGSTLVTAQVDDSLAARARSVLHTAGAERFDWNSSTPGAGIDSDSENYAESSKVGTVGGGTVGAMTGAAMGAAGGPVGAVVGGIAGAAVGGTVGAVGDTVGEATEDAYVNDYERDTTNVAPADRSVPRQTDRPTMMTGADADLNRLDEAGYVAGGLNRDNDSPAEDYAESSKVGTVGGGTAGAVTGAAMGAAGGPVGAVVGGIAGAAVGGTIGAAGDTLGEEAQDSMDATTTPNRALNTTPDQTRSVGDYTRNDSRDLGDKAKDKLADAGNAVERGLNTDIDRDGDIGRRG